MSGYYGEGTKSEDPYKKDKSNTCNQIMVGLSAVLGLVSLLAIIALNIANLTEIYRSKNDSNKLASFSDTITKDLGLLKHEIMGDIKPKTDLINNMASYKIPAMITSHTKVLQADILRFCAPRYETTNKNCPIIYNPIHSALFSLYDLDFPDSCNDLVRQMRTANNLTAVQFASFIPSPTGIVGCTRIPSFSLSNTIYAYTHNMIPQGCDDSSPSTQFWTLGRIAADNKANPIFNNIMNWYLADGLNRKSCTTAAGIDGAWIACTISNQTESDDYKSPGIQDIFIGYMDVFGRKRQWIYNERQIEFDQLYDAFYFSVGSGIIVDDNVYFLAYGAPRRPINEDAYCRSPGCPNPSQAACNQAQRVYIFNNKQVVNAIFTFQDQIQMKPRVHVRTIPPTQYPRGAEGRLYYFRPKHQIFIYLRSSGWHALQLFGRLYLEDPIRIEWYPFEEYSRPGYAPCTAASRCPANCITGVYTDYFPLRENGTLGISVILKDGTRRINPTLRIATLTQIVKDQTVTSQIQEAGYTTTTCFGFASKTWCMSIIEMSPGTIGLTQPVSLLYQVVARCAQPLDDDEGSGDVYQNTPTIIPLLNDTA